MGDPFRCGLLRAAGVTGDDLDLSQKHGGDRPTALRVVVELSTALKKIMLSANSIKDVGAVAIDESLKTNSTLEELELISCDIGFKGAKAIGVGLAAGISALKSINLSNNALCGINQYGMGAYVSTYDATGIQAIAAALTGSSALKKIDLRANMLRDEGKQVVRDVAKGHSELELLL